MRPTSPILRSAAVALVLLVVVTVWWLIPPWHPMFGAVHHSGVIQYYRARQRLPAKVAAWVDGQAGRCICTRAPEFGTGLLAVIDGGDAGVIEASLP